MYTTTILNMDLAQIAYSGQCFRFNKLSDNTFSVIAFDKYLEITQNGDSFSFSCDKADWNNIWSLYFDTPTDYVGIGNKILSSDDEYLISCYKNGQGVRILRQDLWEMIITFMISQNNNIKRITKSVDLLCQAGGRKVANVKDAPKDAFAFPTPSDIDPLVFDDSSMGFGYRADYLKEMFEYTKNNPQWLSNLKTLSFEDATRVLLERKGIGPKVANCICLFGLHHVEAFPIDTHVKQILSRHYPDGFDFNRYEGVAGIIQQYMFYNEIK